MATPLRLLVVEDSERDTQLLLRELKRGGYEPVHERVDTPEALRAAIVRRTWDLVISDYAMPRFSALAALAVVKEFSLDLPFIILSGTIGEETAVAALRAGARDFVLKDGLARLLPAIGRELREAALRAERAKISEQLQRADRLFTDAIESISEGFAVYGPDDRLLRMNSHFKALMAKAVPADPLGMTFEALVRREVAAGHYPEAAGREDDFIQDRLRAHREPGGSFLYKTRDGRWLRARDYRMPDGSIFAVRSDVTDLVQRDQALRESQASLAAAQRIAKLGSWELDLVNPGAAGREPLRWSDETFRIFGYEPGEIDVSNESFFRLVHPDDRESLRQAVDQAIAEGSTCNVEHRARRRDGREIIVQALATVERDAAGAPVRMVGTVQDITERKHIEDGLRQSQKMEAVGQLTGGLAHDFNNLLTVIIGSAEQLEEIRQGENPLAEKLLSNITRAADQASALTRRLLAFARKQPLQPRAVNINEYVLGMKPLLQRSIGEHIAIQMVPAADLWAAYVDPHQVEAAVLNLAINARDAMREGGHLTIETANVIMAEQQAARYGDVTPGEYVALDVSDDGRGMPAEILARAAEPFFTTKPPGEGTGLGLSMVYGFAKQSGGHMNIHSEVGHGTTVRLYFPRARVAAELRGPAPAAPDAPPGGRERILIVEDEPAVRESAVSLLLGLGYAVLEAADGPAALALAERNPPVDLLLTDLIMPGGMNGVALAEALKARQPALRILYCSGYSENAILPLGEPASLLQKPYRRQELAHKIRAALDAPGKDG
jgi:two-component system, cell cycle sensor histidine kinase and response regulator CckA